MSPGNKLLPTRVYKRGTQGTFIYAPDVMVYIETDNYGIIDLSQYITNFSMQRNPNNISTFSCSFDNKYARFDRVIRRMNKIVVFLKRIQWVQVFAGYVTVAPWETVVPGDAMLMAECTLKRLEHTYWDPHSAEAQQLFPFMDLAHSSTSADGGAAASMFKLLRTVAEWDQSQIQIQKIPDKWMEQALQVLLQSKDDDLNDPDYRSIKKSIVKLLDADGWLGYKDISQLLGATSALESLQNKWKSGRGGLSNLPVDEEWQALVGKKNVRAYPSGYDSPKYTGGLFDYKKVLAPTGHVDSSGNPIYLRPDAAQSFLALYNRLLSINSVFSGVLSSVQQAFRSYDDQKSDIVQSTKRHGGSINKACSEHPCPAGISDHGWGTAIDFDPTVGAFIDPNVMQHFGWLNDPSGDGGANNPNHWVFVGNWKQGFPAYAKASEKPKSHRGHGTASGAGQFDWASYTAGQSGDQGTSLTKTAFFYPKPDVMSMALTGKRAWINDVPLIQSIADLAAASMRDFQSAPNGDFIAYFPDRLGIYGKFPAMQVRDIEVIDFKISVSDANLITHYVSVGDFTNVEPRSGTDWDAFLLGGYVTVEQDEVMGLMMGLSKEETPTGLGSFMLQRFGIRPKRDDNYNVRDPGWNYMIALHRFQEAWAAQWQAMVSFTFMPEIYPGMRIELVDHGMAVFVESVTHQGSRTGGFMTSAMVSTPMRRHGDTWVMLRPEFLTEAQAAATKRVVEDSGETQPIQLSNGRYLTPNQSNNFFL